VNALIFVISADNLWQHRVSFIALPVQPDECELLGHPARCSASVMLLLPKFLAGYSQLCGSFGYSHFSPPQHCWDCRCCLLSGACFTAKQPAANIDLQLWWAENLPVRAIAVYWLYRASSAGCLQRRISTKRLMRSKDLNTMTQQL
jgi:hypothetical protein